MLDRERVVSVRLLQEVGVATASGEHLELEALAADLGMSAQSAVEHLSRLGGQGLVLYDEEGGRPPLLCDAGRQYLQLGGDVPAESLSFLTGVLDDLHARAAMLDAGAMLVDEYRFEHLNGDPIEYARRLVPAAFAQAVDAELAFNLYSAAVALMARLSDGRAAGCVAEEIVAVSIMSTARALIEMQAEAGELSSEDADHASSEVDSLFELFQDDDVLRLFDMAEPSDAAVAGHDPINQQLGVADQRIESWFKPFGGVAPTGYLADR